MTRITPTLMALASTALPMTALAAPGYQTQMIEVPHRERSVELHIWYPTQDSGEVIQLGKNAVFKGTSVQQGATPTGRTHPLVVLSHGSGGNAANLSWIAASLAERGMIVVAPNHPGTTSRDSLQAETVKIWERPMDLSAIITHSLAGGLPELTIDADRIGAMGFSLGGYSVMGIAGARASKQGYIEYCDTYPQMMDCTWLKAGGVDFQDMDQARYEQSNLDTRLAAVVSIDPALAQAYDADSLGQITVPLQLINMGSVGTIPPVVDATHLAPAIPGAELVHIAQAQHFSFLAECTMMGAVIIAGAGEGPLCSEVGPRKRADIHTELQATIGGFLTQHLMDQ